LKESRPVGGRKHKELPTLGKKPDRAKKLRKVPASKVSGGKPRSRDGVKIRVLGVSGVGPRGHQLWGTCSQNSEHGGGAVGEAGREQQWKKTKGKEGVESQNCNNHKANGTGGVGKKSSNL